MWFTFRSVLLPMVLPGVVAGSIFTFSLTLGDFITPLLIGGSNSAFIGNAVYDSAINGGEPAVRRGAGLRLHRHHGRLPPARALGRRVRRAMKLSALSRRALAAFSVLVVVFLSAPLLVIVLFAFGKSNVQTFPIRG